MRDGTSNRFFNNPTVADNQFLRIANSGGATNILVSSEDQEDPQQCGFTSRTKIKDFR